MDPSPDNAYGIVAKLTDIDRERCCCCRKKERRIKGNNHRCLQSLPQGSERIRWGAPGAEGIGLAQLDVS